MLQAWRPLVLVVLLLCYLCQDFARPAYAESLRGSVEVVPGLNLVGVPFAPARASDLGSLSGVLDTTAIARVFRLDPTTNQFAVCPFDAAGVPDPAAPGCQAATVLGEGWLVEARTSLTLDYDVDLPCPALDLRPGMNVVALPCATPGLTAFTLLQALGAAHMAAAVQTLEAVSGQWHTAAYLDGTPGGVDFPIQPGLGYLVYMWQTAAVFPPVAEAGEERFVVLPAAGVVPLDGTTSRDDDTPLAALAFQWELHSPAGSGAVLSASNSATPSFLPDVPGRYTAILIVSDGVSQSTDAVELIAIDPTQGPDTDDDGLGDAAEALLGTDLLVRDSDSDGFTDGSEVIVGSDPRNPASTPEENRAPVVLHPGNQRSAEGAQVALTIAAIDPDGDPITFSAESLPPGLMLNPDTGHIAGRIAFTTAGTFFVRLTATDGQASGRVTFTWTVTTDGAFPPEPPDETLQSGFIHGQVVHAVSQAPLADAIVTLQGIGGAVLSDQQGTFAFPTPGSGAFVVTVQKAGFTRVQRRVTVAAQRDIAMEPLFLTPFDPQLSMIGVHGGTHRSSDGEVVVTFPPGAVATIMPVRATRYRAGEHLPGPLPAQSHFTYAVNFQPDGVTFAEPVTYRIRNALGFAPGTRIPVGIYREETASWEALNMAQVTADGQWVEGQVSSFTTIDVNLPVFIKKAAVSPGIPIADLTSTLAKDSFKICGSEIDLFTGTLSTDITLPSVRTLGRRQALTFRYDSSQAFPTVMFGSGSRVPQNIILTPTTISGEFEFQGRRAEVSFTGSLEKVLLRQLMPAQNGRGEFLPTGLYPMHYRPSNDYSLRYATADFFGGPPREELAVVSPELVSFAAPVTRNVPVVNERQSPFGAGWSLEGLERLYPQADGSLLLTDGTGSALAFTPAFRAASFTASGAPDPEAPFHVSLGNIAATRLAFDSVGNLYVADNGTTVYKITPDGTKSTFASGFNFSSAVAVDADDNVYISEFVSTAKVWKYVPDGSSRELFFELDNQSFLDLTFDAHGNLYAASEPGALFRVSPDGTWEELFQVVGSVSSVAVDAAGNIFAAEVLRTGYTPIGSPPPIFGTPRILLRLPDGFLTTYAVGFQSPQGMVIDPEGNLLVADKGLNQILRVTPNRLVEPVVKGQDFFASAGNRPPVVGSAGVFNITDVAYSLSGDLFTLHRFFIPGHTIFDTVSKVVPTARFFPPPGEFSEVTHNPDGTFVRRMKDEVRKHFDADGFLTSVVDRNGNTTTYTYDSDGNLMQIEDPVGRTTVFSYTSGSHLEAVRDPAGRTTAFVIDAANDLVQVTLSDLSERRFTYDAEHRMTSETDPRGYVTTFVYDALGKLREEIRPEHEVIEAGGPTVKQPRRVVQPEQGAALANTLPLDTGTPDNPAAPFQDSDVFATFTDALGRTTTVQSNAVGAPTSILDALGHETTLVRNGDSLPTDITHPNGLLTRLQFDLLGNIRWVEHNLETPTRFSYASGSNRLQEMQNPVGRQTFFTYDAQGNVTQISDPDGSFGPYHTDLAYNAQGLPTEVHDPLGNITSFTYDAHGNLHTITDALLNTTSLAYDAAGNTTDVTDALDRTTQFAYDDMNRLLQVTDAALQTTQYAYDPAGNLLQVTDAKGAVTRFAYNALDALTTITDPASNATQLFYDEVGNLVRILDRKGQELLFRYDALNRLIEKETPDGITTFAYDAVGNLVEARDPDSLLRFTYDPLSRMITATTGDSSDPSLAQPVTSIAYAYDAAGNRVTMTDPTGETRYEYLEKILLYSGQANRGNVTKLITPFGGVFTFAYDALSRRTLLTRPNGTETTRAYDAAGRLTALEHRTTATGTPFSQITYTYDAVGNRTTRTDNAGLHTFTYDALNQLTQVQGPRPEHYAYDAVGNRTQSHVSSLYVTNSRNQLLEDDTFVYRYDANGNLEEKEDKATAQVTRYRYDAENQLVRIDFPDGTFSAYRYDALGRRIEKNVNGTLTRYVYDNEDILLEFDGTDTLLARYTHGPGIDEPLVMERDLDGSGSFEETERFFYHRDALGSITELTDSTGSVVQSYVYDSFGKIVQQAGGVGNPYMYTGREFDIESGLYYYRARYYDSETGIFISEDPIGLVSANGTNLYPYVANNPIGSVDPSGLIGAEVLIGLSGPVGLGACLDVDPATVESLAAGASIITDLVGLIPTPLTKGGSYLASLGLGIIQASAVNAQVATGAISVEEGIAKNRSLLLNLIPGKFGNIARLFNARPEAPERAFDPFLDASGRTIATRTEDGRIVRVISIVKPSSGAVLTPTGWVRVKSPFD